MLKRVAVVFAGFVLVSGCGDDGPMQPGNPLGTVVLTVAVSPAIPPGDGVDRWRIDVRSMEDGMSVGRSMGFTCPSPSERIGEDCTPGMMTFHTWPSGGRDLPFRLTVRPASFSGVVVSSEECTAEYDAQQTAVSISC